MKKWFALPRSMVLHLLVTFLIGAGCTFPLAFSLGLTAPAGLCTAVCAATALGFALLDCLPKLRSLAYPLLFAALAVLVVRELDQFSAISAALTLMLNGQPLAIAAYSRVIVTFLSLLLTGVGASLARSDQAFFPLALMTIIILFVVSFLGVDISPFALLPLTLAIILSSRTPGVRAPRLIACGAIVLTLTALLAPFSAKTLPELSDMAQRVRQVIGDYLFFTEARTSFSLSSTGYQPLGVSHLGGPADPDDTPIMQVKTSGRTLLRGTLKNDYNGQSWTDTTSGRRYLYVNPRFAALKRDLFDQERPEKGLRGYLPAPEMITVSMRAETASTLYLTQRFSSPSGRDIVPYFSPASEVFATRSLTDGDSYSFAGMRLSADTPGIRDVVLSAASAADPYLPAVQGLYMQLPNTIDQRVYALVHQLTAEQTAPFDKAVALTGYLKGAYHYTLDQSTPPPWQDFVSWFLLEEQQGYCTSFASALTIMARIAGLPARYVEGYAAVPDADGIALVTQKNAHAWVEIYFPSFGWLSFDPTPGNGGSPEGEDTGTQEPTIPPPLDPTPTPTPTAEPPADVTPVPTATPSPTPAHNNPAITPTPPITPRPSDLPTPAPTPPRNPQDDPDGLPAWLLPLLILLLLAACAALRMLLTAPARVSGKQKNASDALLIWYRAIEQALRTFGLTPAPGEAPASFLYRAQETLNSSVKLTGLGKALCVAQYSNHALNTKQVERAEMIYHALFHSMKFSQKAKLLAYRFLHGLKLA